MEKVQNKDLSRKNNYLFSSSDLLTTLAVDFDADTTS